ncbi:MAG: type II/IV secretion system ATPase subunit [Candidatus Micrarchaeota archaeon]
MKAGEEHLKGSSLVERKHGWLLKTKITQYCEYLASQKNREADFSSLSEHLQLPVNEVERLGKILQEQDVLELNYPVNILTKPFVRLKAELPYPHAKPTAGEKLLLSYEISANNVPAKVQIWQAHDSSRPIYTLEYPHACPYTERFLNYMRDTLAKNLPVETDEIVDAAKFQKMKERFYVAALELLEKESMAHSEEERKVIAGLLLQRMYGLGVVEILMSDDYLEEVSINGAASPIAVYHRKFGWLKTDIMMQSEEEIYNFAAQIARKSGREISILSPILDAALVSGDRVSATLFPISTNGNTITIRRFARNPWTITSLTDQKTKTMSVEMAAFLWMAIQYELNVLVAGGTASGKTSTLNTLTSLIPPMHRVVSIEDTREISLPSYLRWNWVPLLTRTNNPEGRGRVSMLDLMVESLRMRPDRIIIGEVRRKREAEVMFEAMHTGHAVYTTIHADTAAQVVRRLVEPPIEIPKLELESLHLIVVQYRDRRKGIRRTYEISELAQSSTEAAGLNLNTLFKWRPRSDQFEKVNESSRVFSELNLHTGLTVGEIQEDLKNKQKILEWMLSRQILLTEDVGHIMSFYYKDPHSLLDAARKNLRMQDLLGGEGQ